MTEDLIDFTDFTHRDYRPDHVGNPTPKGIPIGAFGMTPQKAGALLCKVARKSRAGARGKSTSKTVIVHGKK